MAVPPGLYVWCGAKDTAGMSISLMPGSGCWCSPCCGGAGAQPEEVVQLADRYRRTMGEPQWRRNVFTAPMVWRCSSEVEFRLDSLGKYGTMTIGTNQI